MCAFLTFGSLNLDLIPHFALTGEAYMRLNKLAEAEHWYRESLRAKPDHIPAHLTYGKLLATTVSLLPPIFCLAFKATIMLLLKEIMTNCASHE